MAFGPGTGNSCLLVSFAIINMGNKDIYLLGVMVISTLKIFIKIDNIVSKIRKYFYKYFQYVL